MFIRHGESVANAGRFLSGWEDVALTPRGRTQARRAGRLLAETWRDRLPGPVWSSDLQRAHDTARIAMKAWGEAQQRPPPPVTTDARLRERAMGVLSRVNVDEARRDGRMRLLLDWETTVRGGESLRGVAARVLAALVELEARGEGAVVFAHGGVLRVVTGMADGLTTEQICARRIDNARPMTRQLPPGGWAALVDRYKVPLCDKT